MITYNTKTGPIKANHQTFLQHNLSGIIWIHFKLYPKIESIKKEHDFREKSQKQNLATGGFT